MEMFLPHLLLKGRLAAVLLILLRKNRAATVAPLWRQECWQSRTTVYFSTIEAEPFVPHADGILSRVWGFRGLGVQGFRGSGVYSLGFRGWGGLGFGVQRFGV